MFLVSISLLSCLMGAKILSSILLIITAISSFNYLLSMTLGISSNSFSLLYFSKALNRAPLFLKVIFSLISLAFMKTLIDYARSSFIWAKRFYNSILFVIFTRFSSFFNCALIFLTFFRISNGSLLLKAIAIFSNFLRELSMMSSRPSYWSTSFPS